MRYKTCLVPETEAEQAFREEQLFGKEDLLASFSSHMDYLSSDEVEVPEVIRKMRLALYQKFYDELAKSHLPNLRSKEPNSSHYFYENTIGEFSISLEMWHAVRLTWENGRMGMVADFCNSLIDVPCLMLPVEEFADAWGVKPATVLGWIRRGRLRSARKQRDGRLVPSLADKPNVVMRQGYTWWMWGRRRALRATPLLRGQIA